jgi:predicted acylesterase/phospholipase RssA
MPDSLSVAFESRRPLLEYVARWLADELSEVLSDADLSPESTRFQAATLSEFLERIDGLGKAAAAPLKDVPDQITGYFEFTSVEIICKSHPVIAKHITVVKRTWLNVVDGPPQLCLRCVIPPQAKPPGWSSRADVPSLFTLTLAVTSRAKAIGAATRERLVLHSAHDEPYALIMKGGGINGLAYVGAIRELSAHYTFNWFVGTSAGAIAAVLLGAGFSVDELKTILKTKNFSDFFDAPRWRIPINFVFHHGFHPADSFTDWLDILLAKKLERHNRVLLCDLPMRVTVFASQRDKRELRFDSHGKGSDVPAAYAARCSMSIPFVFVPQREQGLRTYDGGMQHNYPVDEILKTDPGTRFVSLYLGPEVYEPVREHWIVSDLISIWTESADAEALEKYKVQTVFIDPRPIRTLDFALTDMEKDYLLACGRAAALAHLDRNSDQCTDAKFVRDDLKCQVETARRSRRRRRSILRYIVILILCLAAGALVAYKLRTSPNRAKSGMKGDRVPSVRQVA